MADAAAETKPEVKKDEETITIRVKDQVRVELVCSDYDVTTEK